jgi:drug/metabolite transporter (DMT)-like permease
MTNSILAALAAAALFGVTVPLAKILSSGLAPGMLAGLLYLGSGIGLSFVMVAKNRKLAWPALSRGETGWLAGAIATGGVLGPALFIFGLTRIAATLASLLLNFEAAFTAALAWFVFREHAGGRIVLGMALIVLGGILLAMPGPAVAFGWQDSAGAGAVVAACFCWGLDNNFTRHVASADALFVASAKGVVAGTTNLVLALCLGAAFPPPGTAAAAMLVGWFGYGISLVLFVVALRGLGSARTGAYFATAPFIGALVAVATLHEPVAASYWLAAAAMAAGVWLHVSERHDHLHTHDGLAHRHEHVHDIHHRHHHDFPWDGSEPHSHEHTHEALTHSHPHFPDLHHRHRH